MSRAPQRAGAAKAAKTASAAKPAKPAKGTAAAEPAKPAKQAAAAKPAKPANETAAAKPPRRAIMVKMDEEVRNELEALANQRRKSVQELGLEAICDLLRKHGRPVSMRDAFRQSAADMGGAAKPARRKSAHKA
jgi:uncharacterized protein (DUF4415 family)